MEKVRFVGLDVHKESIAIAVADGDGSAPEDVATIPNEMTALLKRLRKLGGGAKLRCCYEAGPTGFVLQRALSAAGIECIVVAPSLVPRTAGDRVKTDRRDAVKLARFLRSGDLTEVHVPDAATEAMRDLERSRDDAKRRGASRLRPPARRGRATGSRCCTTFFMGPNCSRRATTARPPGGPSPRGARPAPRRGPAGRAKRDGTSRSCSRSLRTSGSCVSTGDSPPRAACRRTFDGRRCAPVAQGRGRAAHRTTTRPGASSDRQSRRPGTTLSTGRRADPGSSTRPRAELRLVIDRTNAGPPVVRKVLAFETATDVLEGARASDERRLPGLSSGLSDRRGPRCSGPATRAGPSWGPSFTRSSATSRAQRPGIRPNPPPARDSFSRPYTRRCSTHTRSDLRHRRMSGPKNRVCSACAGPGLDCLNAPGRRADSSASAG